MKERIAILIPGVLMLALVVVMWIAVGDAGGYLPLMTVLSALYLIVAWVETGMPRRPPD
jgi:hypothetical protein